MDNNLLILAGISLLAVLLTYIVTKRFADKKVGQYKSIDEALKKAKEEHETLKKANESLQQTNEIAKQALSKINTETADLQALKGQDDSLKVSILEQQQSLDAAQNTLNELNANIEKSEQDLNELMGGIDLYSRLDEYTAHGHFEMLF